MDGEEATHQFLAINLCVEIHAKLNSCLKKTTQLSVTDKLNFKKDHTHETLLY